MWSLPLFQFWGTRLRTIFWGYYDLGPLCVTCRTMVVKLFWSQEGQKQTQAPVWKKAFFMGGCCPPQCPGGDVVTRPHRSMPGPHLGSWRPKVMGPPAN